MEKWFVINKGADFEKLGKEFGISPVTARLIRNREVIGEAAFERYLNGSLKDLYDPHLLKDADRLTDILKVKIEEQKPIRIIGDYDIDGVMSTYILYRGIKHCGGNVSTQIPDRMKDGYGINENLIDQAKRDGMDTILTCGNLRDCACQRTWDDRVSDRSPRDSLYRGERGKAVPSQQRRCNRESKAAGMCVSF